MRILAGCLLLIVSVAASAQEAERILRCMRGNVPTALRVHRFQLSHADAEGRTRNVAGRFFQMREESPSGRMLVHMMIRVDAPADLQGASYLARQEESAGAVQESLYVYLPAAHQVTRIGGETADGAFLGTSFTYRDLLQLANGFAGSNATIENDGQAYERPTRILRFTGDGQRSARVWIDEKSCMPLKADYYEGTALRRQLTTPDFALTDSAKTGWYLQEIDLNDVRDGASTVLKIVGADKPKALPREYFDPAKFFRN
ncbi:MAG TPA: outer membrane lipoprotein-sorting protein [Candidatus Binatia bacterium]|nr:outer membrane lipoprotein-sorting protein [Candidatus Binatia bacterium]